MTRAGRQMMIAALRVTESEADAADAVQEAMIRLWQKSADLADAENPVAYAVTVARRSALDIVRSRHTAEPIEDVCGLSDRRDPVVGRDCL